MRRFYSFNVLKQKQYVFKCGCISSAAKRRRFEVIIPYLFNFLNNNFLENGENVLYNKSKIAARGKTMNLADIDQIKNLLSEEGFSFKKSLGQNFLNDPEVCPKMALASADGETGVLEIGPGMGVLTAELAKIAKKVISLELDKTLEPVLKKTLGEFKNVKIIFGDFLKTDIKALTEAEFPDCKRITVCANLPYYITTKIISTLISSNAGFESLTVMVQREVADRICAPVGSRQAGLFTAQVFYYAVPEMLFSVGKESFTPAPKVDSAVIKLVMRDKPPVNVKNEKLFFSLVSACFSQRRKTLVNSVSNVLGIDKTVLRTALEKMGLPLDVRGEVLDIYRLAELSDLVF